MINIQEPIYQTGKVVAQSSGGFLGKLFLIFSKWKTIIGIFVILTILVTSINAGIKEQNVIPFFQTFGGYVLASDDYLYTKITAGQPFALDNPTWTNSNFWGKLKYTWTGVCDFWDVIVTIYIYYLFYKIINYFVKKGDSLADSSKTKKSIIYLLFIIIIFNLVNIILNYTIYKKPIPENTFEAIGTELIPFKGLFEVGKHAVLHIIMPLFNSVSGVIKG